jgi:hypothetical protein
LVLQYSHSGAAERDAGQERGTESAREISTAAASQLATQTDADVPMRYDGQQVRPGTTRPQPRRPATGTAPALPSFVQKLTLREKIFLGKKTKKDFSFSEKKSKRQSDGKRFYKKETNRIRSCVVAGSCSTGSIVSAHRAGSRWPLASRCVSPRVVSCYACRFICSSLMALLRAQC